MNFVVGGAKDYEMFTYVCSAMDRNGMPVIVIPGVASIAYQ